MTFRFNEKVERACAVGISDKTDRLSPSNYRLKLTAALPET